MSMMEMFSYQREDVEAAVAGGHKSIFLAYEQALGKTLTAIEWAKAIDAKFVIVIAPLNTHRTWKETILKQIPDATIYDVKNNAKAHNLGVFTKIQDGEPGWYIIGWELMRTGAIAGAYADLIIGDEIHRIQNYGKSQTSDVLRMINAEYKAALSGTPSANRPEGIFSPINWLWSKRYKSYHKWVQNFWRTMRDGRVIELIRELEPGGVVADLPFFVRRLKKDHRGDLPPVLPHIVVECEMTRAQRKIYKQFDEVALAWLGDKPVSTAIPLTMDLRLSQATLGEPYVNDEGEVDFAEDCKSSKIDALIEVVQSNDGSFFVIVPSLKFVAVVVHRLRAAGITAETFTGDTKVAERDTLATTIGKNYRVLVATTATVAEGLDGLQHGCSNGVSMALHPNAMLNTQAGERLDRPGQKDSVQWWYLVTPDSVDERRITRLAEISDDLKELYDTY